MNVNLSVLDIDECELDDVCMPYAYCSNVLGSYTCTCIEGFSLSGNECIGKIYNHPACNQ